MTLASSRKPLKRSFWPGKSCRICLKNGRTRHPAVSPASGSRKIVVPSTRYRQISDYLNKLDIRIDNTLQAATERSRIRSTLADIVWNHKDIPLSHLENIKGITCINRDDWRRDQRWDNVFSFYDPEDGQVKIRSDRVADRRGLEVSFLITVGAGPARQTMPPKKVLRPSSLIIYPMDVSFISISMQKI